MTATEELVKVLIANTHKQEVTIDNKNIAEIWPDFAESVYRTMEGTDAIHMYNLLMDFRHVDDLDMVNKKGKLLKRFARHYKEITGTELSSATLGIMGDKLQYYASKVTFVFVVDFTDKIDWEDGQFGKSNSCWWGEYKDSRPTFESAGGWGIRFYKNQNDQTGIGRTWIYPKDGMLMCFNSYGVSRPSVSKTIKKIFSAYNITLHYKTVELENGQDGHIPYINGGTGFVLYPEGYPEEIQDSYDVDMYVIHDDSDDSYFCERCEAIFSDMDDLIAVDGECICSYCYDRHYFCCAKCGDDFGLEDETSLDGDRVCSGCAERYGYGCEECGKYYSDVILVHDTNACYCEDCNPAMECEICGEYYKDMDSHTENEHSENEVENEN